MMCDTVILDASAIIHTRNVLALRGLGCRFYTTNYIIEELKDARACVMPELLGVEVIEIGLDEIEEIRKSLKLPKALSNADVSVIALALRLRNEDPLIVTDDTLLIAVLKRLGFRYKPVILRKRR